MKISIGVVVACVLLGACGGSAAPAIAPSPSPLTVRSQSSADARYPIHLDKRHYKVTWTAQGNDNFNVVIQGNNLFDTLISAIPPNPSSGQGFLDAPGGDYYLVPAPTTLTWTITFTPG